jgi:hypothetical protein
MYEGAAAASFPHRIFEDADAPRELQKINKFGEFAPLTYTHSLTAPVELPTSPRTHACPIGPLLFHAGSEHSPAARAGASSSTMAELNSLESLQALYSDLVALSEKQLSSIERLAAELDAHRRDFKNLLDKKPRNEQSRKSLATGLKLCPMPRTETNSGHIREAGCFW